MLYDLTSFQEYLQTEPPLEIAQALDEAMYDIIMNAEQVGTAEGVSQRYYTLRQLRDIIHNLSPAANEDPRD